MQFATQLRYVRITYAMLMASATCVVMSAVTTALLTPQDFWHHWPRVLGIDLLVANPVAVLLAPFIRRLCYKLYPNLNK